MASGTLRRSRRSSDEVGAVRTERRFEDIISDEEDEEELPSFIRKGQRISTISAGVDQTSKRPNYLPPRKPRSTFHEQVGEDGFIFSIADPSITKAAKSSIPSSADKRLAAKKSHQPAVREKKVEAEAPTVSPSRIGKKPKIDAAIPSKIDINVDVGRSSDTARKIQKTFHPSNGVHPNPRTADKDLYTQCSVQLAPQERVKLVAGWILDRRRKELKESSSSSSSAGESSKYRTPLLKALKSTVEHLNSGSLDIDWQYSRHKGKDHHVSSSSSRGGKLPVHPTNEANSKARKQLEETIGKLQPEAEAWREEEARLDEFEKETESIRIQDRRGSDIGIEDVLQILEGDSKWSAEESLHLQKSKETLKQEGQTSLPGMESDPRWKDVEFQADLLYSKTHSFAQLSSLSHRYISAVSARGAKALKEMTEGPLQKLAHDGNSGLLNASSTVTSTVSRESRDNLERILSAIRTNEEEEEGDEEMILDRATFNRDGPGDTSEGEFLRALAELS